MKDQELVEILLADDPTRLREYVEAELRKRIEAKMRADDERHYRLLMYGTQGAGDDIIPYA